MRTGLWTLLTFLLLHSPVKAFDFDEHEKMSNLALAVVSRYVQAHQEKTKYSEQTRRALESLETTYGRLTACVDYFSTPEKLFSFALFNPPSQAPNSLLPDLSHQIPDLLVSRYCGRENLGYLNATHNNHAHFQHDLLISIRLWRLKAKALLSIEQNPYAALIASAVADHYLQDFFAPGHLVTPRSRLTDVPATAMHDMANRMGAIFIPRWTHSMSQIAEFLISSGLTGAENSDRLSLQLRENQLSSLEVEINSIRQQKPILFRGDSSLYRSEQKRQRAMLLLVQSASILDILDGGSDLQDFSYSYDTRRGLPLVDAAFGSYSFDIESRKHEPITGDDSEKLVGISRDTGPGDAYLNTTASISKPTLCWLSGCDDRTYQVRTRSPIVAFSHQRESLSRGAYRARDTTSLEFSSRGLLVDVGRFSGDLLSFVEVVPFLGVARYGDSVSDGWGPTFRLPISVPETEFSIGPYLRYLSYQSAGGYVRKPSYGVQIEGGFTSYLTFYLGGGKDYGETLRGSLLSGRNWFGGIRISVPMNRLLGHRSEDR